MINFIQTLGGNEAAKTKRLLIFLLPVILLSVGINFPRFFEVIAFYLGSIHILRNPGCGGVSPKGYSITWGGGGSWPNDYNNTYDYSIVFLKFYCVQNI